MNFHAIFYIAFALSLDAFGVSISIGLNKSLKLFNKLLYCFSFGTFQFLFTLLGAGFGILFSSYVSTIPHLAGGIVISIVGLVMIKQGREKKEELLLLDGKMYYILGVSVSIDAMVVGFSLMNKEEFSYIFMSSWIIGITSLTLSYLGIKIAKLLSKIRFIDSYANYIAGIILIIFGIKMIFN